MPLYTCPICKKNVKNLKQHTKRMHPESQDTIPEPGGDIEPGVPQGNADLEIVAPADQGADTGYHCSDCGYHGINKGDQHCPNCGATLNWEGIK